MALRTGVKIIGVCLIVYGVIRYGRQAAKGKKESKAPLAKGNSQLGSIENKQTERLTNRL